MRRLLTMCSSHCRPDRLTEMIASYSKTTKSKNAKLVIYVSDADHRLPEYKSIKISDNRVSIEIGKPKYMVEVLNYFSTVKYPDFDYYSEVNDDHVYLTDNWDGLMMDAIDLKNNGLSIAYGLTENMPTATMTGSKIIKLLGYFFPPEFRHSWVDNWLCEVGFGSNIMTHLENVNIEHRHHIFNKAKKDAVYESVENDYEFGKNAFTKWILEHKNETISKILSATRNIKIIDADSDIQQISGLAVMMTTCDRIDILRETIRAYTATPGRPKRLFVFDDNSDNFHLVHDIISSVQESLLLKRSTRLGVAMNNLSAIRKLFYYGAEHVLIIDSDCLVAKGWYAMAENICRYMNTNNSLFCLFNARVHQSFESPISGFVVKKIVGGLGMLISRAIWEKYLVPIETSDPVGWDGKLCKAMIDNGANVLACSPSYFQHIGVFDGKHAHMDPIDCIANDFIGSGADQTVASTENLDIPMTKMLSQYLKKYRLPDDFGPKHVHFNQPSYQHKWREMRKAMESEIK